MKLPFSLVVLAGIASSVLPAATAQDSAASHHTHTASQPSTTLTVTAGEQHLTLSVADLQKLPQTTITVLNGHSHAEEIYAGPLVSEVLARAGVQLSSATEHDILRSYVVATGTDGYFVVFSGAELQGALHKAQCIVALTRAGAPLTENGAFQLIDPLDIKPARWVRNLQVLTVVPVARSLQSDPK